MFISDEEKGNKLIGEAAMNLLFKREDVTVETLLMQLAVMAESELDESRLLLMHETRRWLQGFRCLSSMEPERAGWLDAELDLQSLLSSRSTIRFGAAEDDQP